jgi:hypothetical protein
VHKKPSEEKTKEKRSGAQEAYFVIGAHVEARTGVTQD